jgi:hypothetical protein
MATSAALSSRVVESKKASPKYGRYPESQPTRPNLASNSCGAKMMKPVKREMGSKYFGGSLIQSTYLLKSTLLSI